MQVLFFAHRGHLQAFKVCGLKYLCIYICRKENYAEISTRRLAINI